MTLFLTVLHVLVCFFLIVVVLLQRGKGAEIGAVFGGGASGTVFGSRGAGNFFTKLTTGAAIVFMVTSLSLAYLANERTQGGLFDDAEGSPAAEAIDRDEAASEGALAPESDESPFVEVPLEGETP